MDAIADVHSDGIALLILVGLEHQRSGRGVMLRWPCPWQDFAVVPVWVFVVPGVCVEPEFCVLLADAAAGFVTGFAGFAAGVELSAGALPVAESRMGLSLGSATPPQSLRGKLLLPIRLSNVG